MGMLFGQQFGKLPSGFIPQPEPHEMQKLMDQN
jgi:hypothetical protein